MTGKSQPGRVIIRSSHEDLSDPTAHLLMPTAEQGPFPPFDRFAESVASWYGQEANLTYLPWDEWRQTS